MIGDTRGLTAYIWRNYPHLISEFEHLTNKVGHLRAKLDQVDSASVKLKLLNELQTLQTSNVDAELANGFEAFRIRVCNRVLQEHCDEIEIKRCPNCGHVCLTVDARQCLECGIDWH